ncbi:hypothetical protein EVAR_54207_1 [Eumeta japonica]|uniref:Uncharacterized protein n=1 Tax=Eumeta variegata TaxID=151549 RepID=A0A4C1YD09_EUMVA|nr:hypothetical protein EVAR_54207_1 [Eumeta japonica]
MVTLCYDRYFAPTQAIKDPKMNGTVYVLKRQAALAACYSRFDFHKRCTSHPFSNQLCFGGFGQQQGVSNLVITTCVTSSRISEALFSMAHRRAPCELTCAPRRKSAPPIARLPTHSRAVVLHRYTVSKLLISR